MSENEKELGKQEECKWEEIDIPIPKWVLDSASIEEKKEVYEYLKSMDTMQKKAYLIAYHHLGTSFNIYKSNGFKEWSKK